MARDPNADHSQMMRELEKEYFIHLLRQENSIDFPCLLSLLLFNTHALRGISSTFPIPQYVGWVGWMTMWEGENNVTLETQCRSTLHKHKISRKYLFVYLNEKSLYFSINGGKNLYNFFLVNLNSISNVSIILELINFLE